MKQKKLTVKLFTGKTVETERQYFLVQFWNAGQWNNAGVFKLTEYEKAAALRDEIKNKYGYQYVKVMQFY